MKKHQLLWFKNLGSAYVAADLAAQKGAKILELFSFGSRGHLFIESDFSLADFLEGLKEKPQNSKEFSSLPVLVLQAYLSLTNPALQNELLIVESEFLGDIFESVQAACGQGLTILDLRFSRDSSGYCYAMLTGSSDAAEKFVKQGSFQCRVQRISQPSKGLRDFFPR